MPASYSVLQIYITVHYTCICQFKHMLCILWFKIGFFLDHFQATVTLIFISFSLAHMYIHYHNQKIKKKIKPR